MRWPASASGPQPLSRNEPVTFTADQVEYDKEKDLVIATGHVEAWQNGHVLRADKIVFDRNTGIAAATGHVVLLEPDGEVMFADYAEMTEQHERRHPEGHARAAGSRTASSPPTARGAPRGKINELSKVVYSTCNLCKKDPTTAAAVADPRQFRRAGPGAQARRVSRTPTLEMFGIAGGLVSHISGTPIRR